MAIKGSLKEASLPDVLQLLALGKKTGCLAIADRQNFGYIYFEDGRICYASIVNRRDRIGDLLRKNQLVTNEQLDQAIRAAGGPPRPPPGRHPDRAGVREPGTAGTTAAPADRGGGLSPVHLDPGDIQLRGRGQARAAGLHRLDQPREPAARGRAPGGRVEPDREEDPQLRPDLRGGSRPHAPARTWISPRPSDGSCRCSTAPAMSAQVMDECSLIEFDAAAALFGLITAGYVRRVGTSAKAVSAARQRQPGAGAPESRASRSTRRECWTRRQREFRRVADLRPDEAGAHFFLGLIALKQARWLEAVDVLQQAVELGGRQAGGAAQSRLRLRAAGPAGRGGGGLRRGGVQGPGRCPHHDRLGCHGAQAQRSGGGAEPAAAGGRAAGRAGAPADLVLGHGARHGLPGRSGRLDGDRRRPGSPPTPTAPRCATTSRYCRNSAATWPARR